MPPRAPATIGVFKFSWVIGVDSDESISQTYHKKSSYTESFTCLGVMAV